MFSVRNIAAEAGLHLRVLKYLKPYRWLFAFAMLSLVCFAATRPLIAYLMKPFFDSALLEKNSHQMVLIPLYLVLLTIVGGFASFFSAWSMRGIGVRMVKDVSCQLFRHFVSLPMSYFDSQPSGGIISKFSHEVQLLRNSMTEVMMTLVREFLVVFGLVGWLLYQNWQLAMLMLLMLPIVGRVIVRFRDWIKALCHKEQDSMARITQFLSETFSGIRVVKLYDVEQKENERFRRRMEEHQRHILKSIALGAASAPLVQVIMVIPMALMIILVEGQLLAGKITVGDFVAFFTACALMAGPLKRLIGASQALQQGAVGAERVFAIIDKLPESDKGTITAEGIEGGLAFRDVCFSYSEDRLPALYDVNLEIRAGEKIAFVGPSGSGKSTLIHLIARFYRPNEGRILLDGVDVERYTLESYRSQIAIVSQEIVLFDETIGFNISYGVSGGVTEKDVLAAAEAAGVMEFASKLPAGLDTLVGENGMQLSGGQRQRIAIARALLRKATILIFDEATSALDADAERGVRQAIDAVGRDRTCIIISHRMSTVQVADRVAVLERGRILEIGTRAELLRRGLGASRESAPGGMAVTG